MLQIWAAGQCFILIITGHWVIVLPSIRDFIIVWVPSPPATSGNTRKFPIRSSLTSFVCILANRSFGFRAAVINFRSRWTLHLCSTLPKYNVCNHANRFVTPTRRLVHIEYKICSQSVLPIILKKLMCIARKLLCAMFLRWFVVVPSIQFVFFRSLYCGTTRMMYRHSQPFIFPPSHTPFTMRKRCHITTNGKYANSLVAAFSFVGSRHRAYRENRKENCSLLNTQL